MSHLRNVAIFIFDNVEVLDFCGPFEVFSVTGESSGQRHFNVYTVAEKPGPIRAINGLSVNPDYTLDTCPRPDILLIPGGVGTRPVMRNPDILNWINRHAPDVEHVLSVCTGALVLATAGLLEGKAATTHHTAFDLLQSVAPTTAVDRSARYVDNGVVITSAGIAAGIDMSLYVVAKLLGEAEARETAVYMEYPYVGSQRTPATTGRD